MKMRVTRHGQFGRAEVTGAASRVEGRRDPPLGEGRGVGDPLPGSLSFDAAAFWGTKIIFSVRQDGDRGGRAADVADKDWDRG